MLQFSDQVIAALKSDHARRNALPVAAALRNSCPENFVGLNEASASERAQWWLSQTDQFGICSLDNVAALYSLWNQWGGFGDRDSEWIVEILRGPLNETEKIASLFELLY